MLKPFSFAQLNVVFKNIHTQVILSRVLSAATLVNTNTTKLLFTQTINLLLRAIFTTPSLPFIVLARSLILLFICSDFHLHRMKAAIGSRTAVTTNFINTYLSYTHKTTITKTILSDICKTMSDEKYIFGMKAKNTPQQTIHKFTQ